MELKEHSTILLLRVISKDEIISVKKFMSSPYFNTNKNISDIFGEIMKFYPAFENKNFIKEFIYKKVFKNKPYNDSNMRWILSEINHLLERYLAQKHFDKDILMKDNYISIEHLKGLRKEFVRKALDNAGKNLASISGKDYMYYMHKYIYQTNELNYLVLSRADKKSRDLDFYYTTFLKALISYINHFIVGVIYDYLNAEIIVSKYLKNGISKKINDIIKILDFPRISQFIQKDNEDAEELQGLIKLLNLFLDPENDSLYEELKEYISANEKKLNITNLSSYYSKLISYCRLKITNSVKEEYYRTELFDLTKKFFEKKYYIDDRFSFVNLVLYKLTLNNILELGKYDYAEKFVKNYSNEVAELHRENAANYGEALISFYKGDFDNALELSSKLSGNFFLTDQKVLKIMLFIEKNFYDECLIEVKTFKKFLKTNKFLAPNVIESLEKFLFIIPYLCNPSERKNMISKKKLQESVNAKGMYFFKGWVSKKITGL